MYMVQDKNNADRSNKAKCTRQKCLTKGAQVRGIYKSEGRKT